MKKHIACFLILMCLGVFSWAQGTKTELFDTKRAQEELEIMKGILSTTLSFVTQSMQKPQPSTGGRGGVVTPFGATPAGSYGWRTSNLNAFYLYGQGAVFMIPTSSMRVFAFEGADRVYVEALQSTSRDVERLARDMERQAAVVARAAGTGAAPPAQAAQAPKPPTPPAPPQVDKEELRKRVAELQEKQKKSREEAGANRAKFMVALAEVKGYLIEALANYGDSLTVVKPGEYISVVILTDSFSGDWVSGSGRQDSGREIITVQKSWITDYKAGRLTLEAFKQKALQYSE